MKSFDVAIVGAGPAGSSVAYYLSQCGHKVILIEKHAFPRDKACGDGLTRESVELLIDMGLAEELALHQKVRGVRVRMGAKGYRDAIFRNPGVGQLSYGTVIPRHLLDHAICKRAVQTGASLLEKTIVTGAVVKDDRVSGVTVRHNGKKENEILATFVVAADGGNSYFARRIGLHQSDKKSVAYAVRGYYSNVPNLEDLFLVYVPLTNPDGTRLIPGYGWVFPLGEGNANIGVGVWPSDQLDFEVNLRVIFDHFVTGLRELDFRFTNMKLLGPLSGAPLNYGMNPLRCVGNGVMLVGDAAGLVNPFTGEGINNALQSGKFAAQVLNTALLSPNPLKADLGEYSRLLATSYRDLFQAGKEFIQMYGFIWKFLESSWDIRRPLFSSVRRTIADYGVGDISGTKAFSHADKIQDLPWLETMNVLDHVSKVRNLLSVTICADFPILWRISSNLLDFDSLLRYTLLFLSSHFGEPQNLQVIRAAAAIELAYLAMILHSDVLDEHGLIAAVGHEASRIISKATIEITMTKMMGLEQTHRLDQGEDRHIQNIKKWMGTFFDLSCRLGAKLGGADDMLSKSLIRYGRNLGVAFQLTNEILDIPSDHEEPLADTITNALHDRVYTLPIIHALRTVNDDRLKDLLARSTISDEEIEIIRGIILTNGCLSYCCQKARYFVNLAKESISPLPEIPPKRALVDVANLVLDRIKPVEVEFTRGGRETRLRFSPHQEP